MRNRYLGVLAVLISFLVVSLPVCFADEINYVLDANGNVLSDGTYNRTYNSLNQLSAVFNASSGVKIQDYIMHPLEERVLVKKTYENDGSWKDTTIYVSKSFVKYKNTTHEVNYSFVYHNGQLVAQEASGVKYFIHGDAIGTTTAVTNSTGGLEEITETSAFGEVISGGEVIDRIYEGKQYDPVLKDLDFHFRKYDPLPKLFLQPDSLIQNVYDPQSLNRYSFERNNPYRYTDPTGHYLVSGSILIWALSVGVLILAAYLQHLSDQNKLERNEAKISDVDFVEDEVDELTEDIDKRKDDLSWSIWEDSQNLIDSDSSKGTLNPSTYTSNIRNEANLNQSVNPATSSLANKIEQAKTSGGGYVEGLGYVTEDGTTYPTSNPDWRPNEHMNYGDTSGGGSSGSACRAYGNASCPD